MLKLMAMSLATTLLMMAANPSAMAQSSRLKPFPLSGDQSERGGDATSVRIAVTYQFFIEGPTSTMAEQSKLADQGRKHLYLMLAKECVVLKQTIARSCAIQRASVNAQLRKKTRTRHDNGIRISGSASYRIKLKPEQSAEND